MHEMVTQNGPSDSKRPGTTGSDPSGSIEQPRGSNSSSVSSSAANTAVRIPGSGSANVVPAGAGRVDDNTGRARDPLDIPAPSPVGGRGVTGTRPAPGAGTRPAPSAGTSAGTRPAPSDATGTQTSTGGLVKIIVALANLLADKTGAEDFRLSDADASAVATAVSRSPWLVRILLNPFIMLVLTIGGIALPRLIKRLSDKRKMVPHAIRPIN